MRMPPRLSGIPATVAAITSASGWVYAAYVTMEGAVEVMTR